MNKKLRFHIVRIIMTSMFLISTIFLIDDANANTINAMLYNDSSRKDITLIELSDGIRLENVYPTKDEVGASYEGYSFKIINNTNEKKSYQIKFINTLDPKYEALDTKFIRYQIIKNKEIYIDAKTIPSDGILFSDEVLEENVYELKLWISNDATIEAMGKYFSSKIALI